MKPTAHTIPWPLKVYLAARSEDRFEMRELRQVLLAHGIEVTSRWLDLDDLSEASFSADRAMMCLEDIVASHVFLLHHPRRSHRSTTGGKHVESGFAIAAGRPFVLYGEIENVFHRHPFVQVLDPASHPARLVETLQLAAIHGTPIPERIVTAARTDPRRI